ncbi:MAG: ATP-dependent helicase [Acidobacteriota bacterium]
MASSSPRLLGELNEQQRFAVTHVDGPMLVLAGAGSGKTRTIIYKIAYLIDEGVCPADQILAVTFTNKAAQEMKARVENRIGSLSASPWISTFHSFGVRVLRRHAPLLGYSNVFTICDSDDQLRIFKRLYRELNLADNPDLPAKKVRSVVSRAKNKGWGPRQYVQSSGDFDAPLIFPLFEAYQKYLKRSNALDFDDLILLTVRLFKEHREIRERYGSWFQHILIDEYQDTNLPQYQLIKHLTCLHQNVSAVGDEDQSIYSFRGADIGNILRFEEDFPGATVVKLEQNYRSTQNILDAATAVVANNTHRKGKVLWTQEEAGKPIELHAAADARSEALFVSRHIHRLIRRDTKVAVLYRTNFQSRQFEEALGRLKIPYRLVGGESFYKRKEVKDALAYLRTARNPKDNVSLLRILNEPARGIGRRSLERLLETAGEQSTSVWEVIEQLQPGGPLASRSYQAVKRFHHLICECGEFLQLPLHLALEKMLESSRYLRALREQETEEADNRILNLNELITVARDRVQRGDTLQEFLDTAALYSETDEYDESAAVTLMTLHNAKGLEFPVVFLVGCEEGLFPHSRSLVGEALEEERRLCYVGMTRAREKLCLSYSRRRRFYGRESEGWNQPSRFLSEIPEHLIQVSSDPVQSSAGYARGRQFRGYSRKSGPVFSGKTYNSKKDVGEFLNRLPKTRSHTTRFISGALVEHERFGRGRLLQVEDLGNDLKLTVRFPELGIKKLLQSYARLRVL